MRTVRMTIDVEIDDDIMYGGDSDQEAKDWFEQNVLLGGHLLLHDNGDVGDTIGSVAVVALGDIGGDRSVLVERYGPHLTLWQKAVAAELLRGIPSSLIDGRGRRAGYSTMLEVVEAALKDRESRILWDGSTPPASAG